MPIVPVGPLVVRLPVASAPLYVPVNEAFWLSADTVSVEPEIEAVTDDVPSGAAGWYWPADMASLEIVNDAESVYELPDPLEIVGQTLFAQRPGPEITVPAASALVEPN